MTKTLEEVVDIKRRFSDEYFRSGRNKDIYIFSIGIGKHRGEDCIKVRYDPQKTSFEIPDNYEGVLVVKIPSRMAEATS